MKHLRILALAVVAAACAAAVGPPLAAASPPVVRAVATQPIAARDSAAVADRAFYAHLVGTVVVDSVMTVSAVTAIETVAPSRAPVVARTVMPMAVEPGRSDVDRWIAELEHGRRGNAELVDLVQGARDLKQLHRARRSRTRASCRSSVT